MNSMEIEIKWLQIREVRIPQNTVDMKFEIKELKFGSSSFWEDLLQLKNKIKLCISFGMEVNHAR